jgi:hypothetical protein
MRVAVMLSVLGFVLPGCGEEGAPPTAPGLGDIVVYEAGPHLAQCASVVITRTQSAARLTSAGIDVRRSSCGYIESMAWPAVCGAGTGEILLHDIPASSLEDARAAGFEAADKLEELGRDTGWRREKCPQYLHAIEQAQATTSCAEIRNRVFSIQNVAQPEQRFSLLDQAGMCADAGYQQVLFGDEGDNVLCSNADSIAGPRRSCAAAAYTAMFDTILANLDEDDLGLGAGYNVGELPVPR